MEVVHAAGSMPCSRALRLNCSTGGSNALLISCAAFMCVTASMTPDKVNTGLPANVLKSRLIDDIDASSTALAKVAA